MKHRNYVLSLFALLLLGTTTILGGCATTGVERAASTSNAITDVDTELRKIATQIDATAKSLDTLVNADQSGLKKSYDDYVKNVDKLDSMGKSTKSRLAAMKGKSKVYFDEWSKQNSAFTNQAIKEASEQRIALVKGYFGKIAESGSGIIPTYDAYLVELKEIKLYLSNDLTPSGMKLIQPVVQKSTAELGSLKESLNPVLGALDGIKSQLTTAK